MTDRKPLGSPFPTASPFSTSSAPSVTPIIITSLHPTYAPSMRPTRSPTNHDLMLAGDKLPGVISSLGYIVVGGCCLAGLLIILMYRLYRRRRILSGDTSRDVVTEASYACVEAVVIEPCNDTSIELNRSTPFHTCPVSSSTADNAVMPADIEQTVIAQPVSLYVTSQGSLRTDPCVFQVLEATAVPLPGTETGRTLGIVAYNRF